MVKMRIIFYLIIFSSVVSCTSFNNLSEQTKTENCENSSLSMYRCVKNEMLKLDYVSFGGFKFAKNIQEYRNFKVKNKPHFKNVIVYGYSNIIETDYYILLNNSKKSPTFDYKDTIIGGQKITLAVKKSANKLNKDFLLNGFAKYKD